MVPLSNANQMIEHPWSVVRPWLTRDDLLSMSMYESEEGVVVEVSLPGVSAEDLEISVMGDTLTLKGELARSAPEGANYMIQERSYGRFQRSIQLPGVMSDRVDATLEKGVLRLVLFKPKEERPRKIQVKAIQ
jgi:HSP20 family protein